MLDALLDAIRDDFDDDLPRLALADWCMEQPEPHLQARGEFIGLHCRMARLPSDDPERATLSRHLTALRRKHAGEWLGLPRRRIGGHDYERGLPVVYVDMLSEERASLDQLAGMSGWKWVTGLKVTNSYPEWQWRRRSTAVVAHDALLHLARSPYLDSICSLDVRRHLDADILESLVRSEHTRRLARLFLGQVSWSEPDIELLTREGGLPGLRHLIAPGSHLNAPRVRQLIGASHWRLTHLDLAGNPMGDDGVRAIAWAAHLANLTRLDLAQTDLTNEAALALGNSPYLTRLSWLDLSSNLISTAGAVALADSAILAGLTFLDLDRCPIGSEGVQALARSQHLARLEYLGLRLTGADNDAIVALAESPGLANLRCLKLGGNQIGDRGAEALASSPYLSNLQALYLGGNGISMAGREKLTARFGQVARF